MSDLFDPGFLADRIRPAPHDAELDAATSPFYELQTAVLVCAAIAVLVVVALRIPLLAAGVAAWLALSCFGLAAIYWIGRLELGFYLCTSVSRVGTTIIVAATVLAAAAARARARSRAGDARRSPNRAGARPEQRRPLAGAGEELVGAPAVRLEVRHQVRADVPDDDAVGDVADRQPGREHALERLAGEVDPRLDLLDDLRATARAGWPTPRSPARRRGRDRRPRPPSRDRPSPARARRG